MCLFIICLFKLFCLLSYHWILSSSDILYTNPLLDMYFASIFYQSVACVFVFLQYLFQRSFIFNFNEVQVTNFFSFMDYYFTIVSKNSSNSTSPRFLCMLSSRIFIVLQFTFRSMIHFELIFVKSMSVFRLTNLFLHVISNFSTTFSLAKSSL